MAKQRVPGMVVLEVDDVLLVLDVEVLLLVIDVDEVVDVLDVLAVLVAWGVVSKGLAKYHQ